MTASATPAVHRQCIGRRLRDGINGPVLAYFLVANEGSDPVVAEVLQLKQAQLDGFLNLGAGDVLEQRQGDGSHIMRLRGAGLTIGRHAALTPSTIV